MKCLWPHVENIVDRVIRRQNEALHAEINAGAEVALKQLEEIERKDAFNKATLPETGDQ